MGTSREGFDLLSKPEVPTLDEQIELMQKCVEYWQSDPRWSHILASLNRLRAIENAQGLPEEPELQECHECWANGEPTCSHYDGHTVWLKDYDALRLSHQHLRDSLNRMEALMREPDDEILDAGRDAGDFHILHYDGTDKPGTPRYSLRKSWNAMSAALLAKVEGRE